MSNVTWNFVTPLEDPNAVELFEAETSMRVPDELKSLIQQYNAGYPEPCTVEVPTLGKRDVKMLLSYNRNDDETVYQVIAYFMRAFHKRVLPFASDSFSGYYCIKDGSAVVFLDEEESTVYPVSESIATFFNMLA